jgi:hypothetical protein
MIPTDAGCPLIYVIVSMYNRAAWLLCTRNDLSRQIFEAIVVEDGGSDGTAAQPQTPFPSACARFLRGIVGMPVLESRSSAQFGSSVGLRR